MPRPMRITAAPDTVETCGTLMYRGGIVFNWAVIALLVYDGARLYFVWPQLVDWQLCLFALICGILFTFIGDRTRQTADAMRKHPDKVFYS